MKVNIEAPEKVRAGSPALVSFEADLSDANALTIFWGGVKMVTRRPCKNPLVITNKEIFCKGTFEPGTYQRQVEIPVARKIIPSVAARNILYTIDASIRMEKAPNSDEEIEITTTRPLMVETLYDKEFAPHPNPVNFSLGGLTITLNKDVYRVGEAIKVGYNQRGFKHLAVKLMQAANVLCSCPQYGSVCTSVEELPAVVANANKKDLTTQEGFLLLKIPKVSEPSHTYQWKPTAETFWGHAFGDVSEWFIEISGKSENPGLKPVRFQVPITICPEAPETRDDSLFEPAESPVDFKVKGRPKNAFEVTSVQFDDANRIFEVSVANRLPEKTLEGVTIKAIGMQEGLFETAPFMFG